MDAREKSTQTIRKRVIASSIGTIKLHELDEYFEHSYENILVIKLEEGGIFESINLLAVFQPHFSYDD
eukprot:8853899-Ditylum_brightwellii.AAC.1